jgi:DNA-binding response OmpR family regulator
MASSLKISQFADQGMSLHAASPQVSANQDVVMAGDFRLDLGTGQASLRGQDLRLTEEEFELLLFLVSHPKSIITPQTRLSTRWGGNEVRQADFLRVLAQLRKKLQSTAGCARYLRTEPWVIYSFDPHNRDEVH